MLSTIKLVLRIDTENLQNISNVFRVYQHMGIRGVLF